MSDKKKVSLLSPSVTATNLALRDFLNQKSTALNHLDIPQLSDMQATELIRRIDKVPLYAHAYAFHLNFRIGDFSLDNALSFAQDNGLKGLKIHVSDGGERSLGAISENDRKAFGVRAANLGLDLHIETSSTDEKALNELVEIGLQTGATSVRCYPRNVGAVSEVKAKTIQDLKHLFNLDPNAKLNFTIEQHEDLKSSEIVEIVKAVNHPRLGILFDFGNSVNAYEKPEEALEGMGDYVSEVHAKDIHILADRGGWGHKACRSGEGDINIPRIFFHLLMLGESTPQVTSIGLEEEVDYYAPAFRFPNEKADPYIPYRGVSETDLPSAGEKEERLRCEKDDAQRQVTFVKTLLSQMRSLLEDIQAAHKI